MNTRGLKRVIASLSLASALIVGSVWTGTPWAITAHASGETKQITPATNSGTMTITLVIGGDDGNVEIPESKQSGNFASGGLGNSASEVKDIVLTAADKEAMALGKNVDVWLIVNDNTAGVPAADKALVDNAVTQSLGSDYTVGSYLDLTLWKQITGETATKVTNVPNGRVKVAMSVPEALRKNGRDYKIVRIHDGVASIINTTVDETTWRMTFDTDAFSTYALTYSDGETDNTSDWLDPYRGMLHAAGESGEAQTVEFTGDFALPREFMEYLKEHPQVTLVYHVNYEGEEFTVTIPGSKVIVEESTDWYGPLGLRVLYAEGAANAKTTQTFTSPKTGETLCGGNFWLLVMAAGIAVSAGMLLGRKKSGLKDQK